MVDDGYKRHSVNHLCLYFSPNYKSTIQHSTFNIHNKGMRPESQAYCPRYQPIPYRSKKPVIIVRVLA